MGNGTLIISEIKDMAIRNVTFEAVNAAKQIDTDTHITAVLCGSNDLSSKAQTLVHYGVDKVVMVKHDHLEHYTPEGYTQAVSDVISDIEPDTIIAGHTGVGKDLTPKLAQKHNLGLISDVITIENDGSKSVFTRPIYAGKAFEKKKAKDEKQFITIRPNNFEMLEKDESRTGEIVEKSVDIQDLKTIIKEVVKKSADGVDLSEARVVVSGGRGVKSAEGFKPLEELADLLGGAVGASRGACDAEYCDYALQIGQTGKVVTPDLYIACGISGAIQHLAGMSSSKVIVAINKDPEANIFNVADYGIVGDVFDIIPRLIEEVKKIK